MRSSSVSRNDRVCDPPEKAQHAGGEWSVDALEEFEKEQANRITFSREPIAPGFGKLLHQDVWRGVYPGRSAASSGPQRSPRTQPAFVHGDGPSDALGLQSSENPNPRWSDIV